jgi:hypothetical protein
MTTERGKTTGLGGFRQDAIRISRIHPCHVSQKGRQFSLLSWPILPNQDLTVADPAVSARGRSTLENINGISKT